MSEFFWSAGRAALHALAFSPRLALRRAMHDPQAAQERVFRRVAETMSATAYGRRYGLRRETSYASFASSVPVVRYDDLEPWIERQMAGEERVIVDERVAFYEPTSGSSGPRKLIPYTRTLRNAFTNMFLLWADDVVRHGPRLRRGSMFLSISPAVEHGTTPTGVPIGSSSDADYVSAWSRALVSRFLVLPPSVAKLHGDAYYRAMALHLLAADPEVVSVWNPSILLLLVDYIDAHRRELDRELANGASAAGVRLRLRSAAEPLTSVRLISCWGSAEARGGFLELRRRFPHVFVQRKGLLATEAPITFPSIAAGGFVPLLNDVFLEFEDEEGRIALLHELAHGREYSVVLTHAAGLLRYRIGDRVRVSHFVGGAPALEFIGRADAVSDLVGEKLHTEFVASCMAALEAGAQSSMLLPTRSEARAGYLLVTESPDADELARALDQALRQNPRYDEARDRRQLETLRGLQVSHLEERHLQFFLRRGMKLGDIKPRPLWTDVSVAAQFIQTLEDRDASSVQ